MVAYPHPADPRFKDWSGQKINDWIIISYQGGRKWLCQCVCGAEHIRQPSALENSCRECKHQRMRKPASSVQYHTHKGQAKLRGKAWAIDKAYFIKLIEEQEYKCKLTDLPIQFGNSAIDYQHGGSTASLDRINSASDYRDGNLQWVHKDINRMKMDFTQERFIELCHLITAHQKK